ncbi:MAG TPA: DUF2268 domain-containing putative Zn-dependent protease [Longimicrobium sp.]|nr:DUF2268 domain-containing putative Zn-dependent protease [Longimicrobium sp.]
MLRFAFRTLRALSICTFATVLSATTAAGQERRVSADPDSARLVTADVERFWAAVDRAPADSLAAYLQREYIDPGSPGVRGFTPNRIVSADALAKAVRERRARYDSARAASLSIHAAERAVRAPFYALEHLYPDAVFPDVYFVVGRLSSGGTLSDTGLMIGAEMYRDASGLPHIVAHELIHFQQAALPFLARRGTQPTLLEQSLLEGSADFVAELISGKHINAAAHAYGRANEKALWAEFRQAMGGRDYTGWLYGDPPGERPADLGYFVGYRIVEAYYLRAADRKQAIRDILTMTDFEGFLARSGYQP